MRNLFILAFFFLTFNKLLADDFWSPIYSTQDNIFCVESSDNGYIFLGTESGVLRSDDSGETWELVLSAYLSKSIYLDQNNTIYASPYPFRFSLDFGDTWEQVNLPAFCDIIEIFVDSLNNIFVGYWGGIFKSSDNGVTWSEVLSHSSEHVINSIIELPNGKLLAGSLLIHAFEDCGVFSSDDNGETWSLSSLENNFITDFALDNDSGIVYASSAGHSTSYQGGVFRSDDLGVTWISIVDELLVNCLALNSISHLFIGCSNLDGLSGGVRKSTNNGANWEIIDSQNITTNDYVKKLHVSSSDFIYAIVESDTNRVYRSRDETMFMDDTVDYSILDIDLSNYPNPFNPSTTISFSIPNDSNVSLNIFNLKGQKVKTLVNSHVVKGKHVQVWNGLNNKGNRVASGIYFYKLNINGKTEVTKKCLLLK